MHKVSCYPSNLWLLKGVQFFPKKSSGHCGLSLGPEQLFIFLWEDLPNIHFCNLHTHRIVIGGRDTEIERRDFFQPKRKSVGNKTHFYGPYSISKGAYPQTDSASFKAPLTTQRDEMRSQCDI